MQIVMVSPVMIAIEFTNEHGRVLNSFEHSYQGVLGSFHTIRIIMYTFTIFVLDLGGVNINVLLFSWRYILIYLVATNV